MKIGMDSDLPKLARVHGSSKLFGIKTYDYSESTTGQFHKVLLYFLEQAKNLVRGYATRRFVVADTEV